ncbi:MAG TPA: hydantoinase/oxoprolinase family protein, partial [Vitreimonas sp.]|nr:hydantoinase/oxoprolinase family protein [Vitreimonas sp.]
GDDVREFALVAAGGAGPLHAVALAAELGMRAVCVPLAPGLLSALGLLAADLRHDLSSPLISFMEDLTSERVEAAFGGLEADAHALLDAEGVSEGNRRIERAIDIRSVGQEWSLGVPVEPGDSVAAMVDRFHQRHDRVYGHSSPGEPVESVAIRVVARGIFPRPRIEPPPAASEPEPAGHRPVWFPEASGFVRAAVVDRASIGPGSEVVGPAVITQLDTTVLVPPGHVARRVAMGSLAIRSAGAPDA